MHRQVCAVLFSTLQYVEANCSTYAVEAEQNNDAVLQGLVNFVNYKLDMEADMNPQATEYPSVEKVPQTDV